jgi:hypothetical protein
VAPVWEPRRGKPGGTERVCVTGGLLESVSEVVERFDGGFGETHVAASGKVAGSASS